MISQIVNFTVHGGNMHKKREDRVLVRQLVDTRIQHLFLEHEGFTVTGNTIFWNFVDYPELTPIHFCAI